MSTVAFIVEFMKLKYCAGTEDSVAIGYLKDNMHPQIHYQLFTTGQYSNNYDTMLTAIKEIGANLEAYCMYVWAGQEASPSKINQIKALEYGLGAEEEVSALTWDNKCYSMMGPLSNPLIT